MTTGQYIYINTTIIEPDTAFTHGGDDTIIAVTDGNWSDQAHIYANAGDDYIQLGPTTWTSRIDIMHGAHIFTGDGADTVALIGLADVRPGQVISGRLDDFDPGSDVLLIDGQVLDLHAPQQLRGYTAEVILYDGQQHLRVENAVGGQFIYALEGARLVDLPNVDHDQEEMHFLTPKVDRAAIMAGDWQVVSYENPMNAVPEALYARPPATAPVINGRLNEEPMSDPEEAPSETLTGSNQADVINGKSGNDIIFGGGGNDTIDGGTQMDSIIGGAGDDVINAGKGHDTVHGGSGNDLIAGGTDRDRLMGGDGNDSIWGGTENDYLAGGNREDGLWGGRGNDLLYGGAGDDRLSGDSGADRLDGGAGDDVLSGGGGADLFIFYNGQGHDVIEDFGTDADRLRIYLGDASRNIGDHASQIGSDLVIALGQESSLTIRNMTLDDLREDLFLV